MKTLRLSTLHSALLASLAVHAGVLAVRLGAPQALERVWRDSPLDVVLVNARSPEPPASQAVQALAQANLAGGGEAASGRATSPLPAAQVDWRGQDLEQAQRTQTQALQTQQNLLLADVRSRLRALPRPSAQTAALSPAQREQLEKRRQLLKLLAEIERRIALENARPKRHFVSPATREVAYAQYYDRLRRAIEARGTQQFPQADGAKLYGALTLSIEVDHSGRVRATRVEQGSGDPRLDRAAQRIAQSAGPFGAFDAALRAQSDRIVVVSRFRFTHDETLAASLSDAPSASSPSRAPTRP